MRRVMMLPVVIVVTASAFACNTLVGIDGFRLCEDAECVTANVDGSDAPVDAPLSDGDAATTPDATPLCNPSAPFGTPVSLTTLASSFAQNGGWLSADGKRFYFARQSTGNAGYQVWISAVNNGAFGAPAIVSDVSDPDAAPTSDFAARESPDGTRLYFFSYRPPSTSGYGGAFISSRAADGGWAAPTLFADGYSAGAGEMYPVPGAIYQPYGFALKRLLVDSNGDIGAPVDVDPDGGSGINIGGKAVLDLAVTADERHVYFTSDRSGLYQFHIYESDRALVTDPWGQPVMLPQPINSPTASETDDYPAYVTPDNCTLYYSSAVTGVLTMYKVTRTF